jgi:hypothetical protein
MKQKLLISLLSLFFIAAGIVTLAYNFDEGPEGYTEIGSQYQIDENTYLRMSSVGPIVMTEFEDEPRWVSQEFSGPVPNGLCKIGNTRVVTHKFTGETENSHTLSVCNPWWPAGYWVQISHLE